MYLLHAVPEKFGKLPSRTALITEEVLFTHNLAYCSKFYWKKHHLLQGCTDVTPAWMNKLRPKRKLNKILFVVAGGFGDVLWTTPFISETRKKYPQATILVATDERTMPIFQNAPYANFCVKNEYWNLQNLIRNSDEVYDFGGIATFLKKEMKLEPVEACFFHGGLPHPKGKKEMRPHLVLTIDEGKQTEALLRREGIAPDKDIIISICLESSTPNRNWLLTYTKILTQRLIAEGKKVIWLSESKDFGDTYFYPCDCGWEFSATIKNTPDSIKFTCPQCKKESTVEQIKHPDGVINLAGKTSIRQAMAVIALSNVFIGPCSGLMVVATSLEIPTVGLFGAFSPKRIAKYYDKFLAVESGIKCSPCNEHWTECREGYPAPCMKLIPPEGVHYAIDELLKKYPRHPLGKLPME